MNEPKQRYLIRMTTLRGCFYMCGNLVEGICGWTTSDMHTQVTRYQMLHAAKRQAQLKWQDLNQVFEVLAIDVITPMGETVWTAEDDGQAKAWIAKAMHDRLATVQAERDRVMQANTSLNERVKLLTRAVNAIWGLVAEEDRQAIAGQLILDGNRPEDPTLAVIEMLERKGAAMEVHL